MKYLYKSELDKVCCEFIEKNVADAVGALELRKNLIEATKEEDFISFDMKDIALVTLNTLLIFIKQKSSVANEIAYSVSMFAEYLINLLKEDEN